MCAVERRLFVFLYCFFIFSSIFSQNGIENAALSRFEKYNGLKHAAYGVRIVDLSSGEDVISYNKDMVLCPASTLKLLTTATCLEIYGSKFHYMTSVFSDGIIDGNGVLKGNIYIRGEGDPTLGSKYLYEDPYSFLSDWTDSLKAKGIRSVEGSVISLDGLFGYMGVSPRWTWEDIGNYYGTGAYGISVFDDTYTVFFKSGNVGSLTEITDVKPFIKGLKFRNEVRAAADNKDNAYIYGGPFTYERYVAGTVPSHRSAFPVKGSLPDPGYLLASIFSDYLTSNGIPVKNPCSTNRLNPVNPEERTRLASFVSRPLSDIVSVINHVSNNHYAQHLFKKLESDGYAVDAIKKFWHDRNVDIEGAYLNDGNGLSPSDAISAGMLTDLLVYMNKKSKEFVSYYNSFPVAGESGTVRNLLKGTCLAGNARIKTGSIEGVQSYAGYFTRNGKQYAFAVIVNDFSGDRSTLIDRIESLLTGF